MSPARVRAAGAAVVMLLAACSPAAWGAPAVAGPSGTAAGACRDRGVEVDLAGSGDVGVVSGRAATCSPVPRGSPRSPPAPSRADELLCAPDLAAAAGGLCAAVPCRPAGLYLALPTLRLPDGTQQVARTACMSLRRARAGPGISAAEVLRAVRAVKLPGGRIRASPSGRGLANLAASFRLDGAGSRTVDLPLRGSMIHAEFQVAEHRWRFGDGSAATSVATGLPDSLGRAHAYARGGRFEVQVQLAWSAEAFLDGRRVGRLDGLVSAARISYPVAELRAALSG